MHSVVVGLGKTGASCLRYLAKRGMPVRATDSRRTPPGLEELGALGRSLDLRLGGFDLSLLDGASQVLMSPGVALEEPIARAARDRGIEVLGDVELFARNVRAPVIGITGTNGKSTVTSLVARMAAAAGRTVLAGGNLGVPALDLLELPVPDLYVLELSSFQLETTWTLKLLGAVVLNVTADHMDRYASVADYARAKSRIFANADTVVLNADDPLVAAMRGTRGADGHVFRGAHGRGLLLAACRRKDAARPPRRRLAGRFAHENRRPSQCGERARRARPRRRGGTAHARDARRPRDIRRPAAPLGVDRGRRRASASSTTPRAPTWARPSPRWPACRDRC